MIMNYVLSFCKITAASRIFSRNFYLPLLKPITPKDALRTFKITGKWLLGSKIHHYIPVLYNHKKKRSKRAKNYGKVVHKQNHSYTYMSPVLDPENENHKLLAQILDEKKGDDFFVYTVEDKMYNIVFPGQYELAIRDGDIIDVLVSQSNDKILIKLKNFKKISVELDFYEDDRVLYKGEGATSEEEEKFHHHGKMIMSLAKIFEAKEKAEEWEMEMMRIVAKKKKQKGEGSKEWNEMVNESIQNLNWQQFEVDAKKVIDQIWEPAQEEHIGMEVEDLSKTRNVPQFITRHGNAILSQLPTMTEIPEVVKSMATATYHEYEEESEVEGDPLAPPVKRRMSGVKVLLASGKECFVTGQMVKTEEGEVFVPGQTIENDFGESYAPGFTINMDGKPSLVKGLIMGEDDVSKPMFLPTESSITTDGELTFCRNPEEKSKTMPQKIFIKKRTSELEETIEIPLNAEKKKKKKKKAKKPVEEPILEIEEEPKIEIGASVENLPVLVEEQVLEVIVCVENPEERTESSASFHSEESAFDLEERKKTDDDIFKPLDDGMEKLIVNLQDKKSELERKLEELRKLTVTLENAVTYVKTADANEIANKITSDLDKMHKLSEILLTITLRANTFREKHAMNIQNISNPSMIYNNTFVTESDERFHACSESLKVALKSAVYATNEVFKSRPKDQLLAMHTLADILKDSLLDEKVMDELVHLMNTKLDRNEICTSILKELTQAITENKVEVLKSAICLNEKEGDNDTIIEKISEILEITEGDALEEAFKKVAKNNEDLTRKVMEHAKLKIDEVKTEMGAKEAVQSCIVTAAKEFAEECLLDLENYADEMEIREVLTEAAGLAGTLGLYEVKENLSELSAQHSASVLTGTKSSTEFLKRFMLIRKLCERDYSVKTSLQRIKKHPECGRTDPRIRSLLKESAALIAKPRQIKNSLEVPLRLFQEQNFLAIEDCLNQKAQPNAPILISRKGIQAVVPKEAARNVLAGRVSYILVDESGITNFKPMHMFSALKMGKAREKHYEDFSALGGRRESYPRISPGSDVRSTSRKLSLNDSRMTA